MVSIVKVSAVTIVSPLPLCTYHYHALPTPGQAQVGITGDLQESFDKFPTPGDNFMLQIPYILYRDSKNNENSWANAPTLGTNYADKSLQIPTHYPTWGRWGLTMISTLRGVQLSNPLHYSLNNRPWILLSIYHSESSNNNIS